MIYDYVVVDTKLLAYNSSFYRHEPVTNFLNIVMRALIFNKIQYKKLVWAYDTHKSEFRLNLHSGYKGGRKVLQDKQLHTDQSRRDEFVANYKKLPSILKYIGMNVNHDMRVEADDVPYLIKQLDPDAKILCISLDGDWVFNLEHGMHILKYSTNTLITDESYVFDTYGMSLADLKEAWSILGQEKDSIYGISKIGLKRWADYFAPLEPQARYELLQEWLDKKKYGCKIDTRAPYDTWQDNFELNKKLMSFIELKDYKDNDVQSAISIIRKLEVPTRISFTDWVKICLLELGEVPPIEERTFLALQESIHK